MQNCSKDITHCERNVAIASIRKMLSSNVHIEKQVDETPIDDTKMSCFLERIDGCLVFNERVKKAIKHNMAEVKRLISDPSALTITDDKGHTLLHVCATYGNVDFAKFLVLHLADVEAKTKSGRSPLTLAIACSRFNVAELLLQMNAEVYSETHPQDSALRMAVMNSMIVPPRIFKLLYDSLKASYTTSEMLAVLREVECPLDGVVAMQNSVLTRKVLESRTIIEEAESFNSIRVAVELSDVSNVRVLMHEGVDPLKRTYAFFAQLLKISSLPRKELEVVRLFVDYVSDWHAWGLYPVDCVRKIFQKADESVLKMFLEYEIHLSIKNQSGIDVVSHLYANRNPGVAELIKKLLIKRQQPIELGIDGKPGLHHAVSAYAVDNVKIHLGTCESPDVLDQHGRPALFEAFGSSQNIVAKEQCVLQLLIFGADVQIVDHDGKSVFDLCRTVDDHHLIQLVLAHLAMRESMDFAVEENIKYRIIKNEFLVSRYRMCLGQLDMMKKHWVSKAVTAYGCLTQPTPMILMYLTDAAMRSVPAHRVFMENMNGYYVTLFDGLLDEIKLIMARKAKATIVVRKCFGRVRMCESVVEKIVGYLSYIDLCVFD